jgi:hypothetical protein
MNMGMLRPEPTAVLLSTGCSATVGRSTDAALHDAYALNRRALFCNDFRLFGYSNSLEK